MRHASWRVEPMDGPLVVVPAETGQSALYPCETGRTIEGWDETEARALILSLSGHMTAPALRQSYRMNVGDIVILDNFAVSHSATPIEYSDHPGKYFIVERISTKEVPPIRPILWEQPSRALTVA